MRTLSASDGKGQRQTVVDVAIAREIAAFLWDIAGQVDLQPPQLAAA